MTALRRAGLGLYEDGGANMRNPVGGSFVVLALVAVGLAAPSGLSGKPVGNFCENQAGVSCNVFKNKCNTSCGNPRRYERRGAFPGEFLFRSGAALAVVEMTGSASVVRSGSGIVEPLVVFNDLDDMIGPDDAVVAGSQDLVLEIERIDIDEEAFPPSPVPSLNSVFAGRFDTVYSGSMTLEQIGSCNGPNRCGLRCGALQVTAYDIPAEVLTVTFTLDLQGSQTALVTNSVSSAGRVAVRQGEAVLALLSPGQSQELDCAVSIPTLAPLLIASFALLILAAGVLMLRLR